jgi:predicted aldo/keto reductase-like oxidoreductase
MGGGPIDTQKADEMIAWAFENGINYYDTAYGYHGGESELFIGKSLARFPRGKWYLASKFPGYDLSLTKDPPKIFNEQLQKCGVDYFDFYLIHNVIELNIEAYTDKKLGIVDYLLERKKAGQIRHLGFSCHGRNDTLVRYLDFCGNAMEFCQIQLNALDWFLQDAKGKYEILTDRGLEVWVMEPVRGGKLAVMSPENERKLKEARPSESAAAWGFRWLQTLPRLGVILSGMTTIDQVADNIKTFERNKPLNSAELALYEEIISGLADMIPCTACRYCCPDCPQDLDIPTLLSLYNEARYEPTVLMGLFVDTLKADKRPSACVECGQCEDICPQKIKVPEYLKLFSGILAQYQETYSKLAAGFRKE